MAEPVKEQHVHSTVGIAALKLRNHPYDLVAAIQERPTDRRPPSSLVGQQNLQSNAACDEAKLEGRSAHRKTREFVVCNYGGALGPLLTSPVPRSLIAPPT